MNAKKGFGLVDVMIAMAIFLIGSYVMISILPRLIATANKRSSQNLSYLIASSLTDSFYYMPYSNMTSNPGNAGVANLLPGIQNVSNYTWSDSVSEDLTDLRKMVTLNVKWGSGADKCDTYVFYIADMNDD